LNHDLSTFQNDFDSNDDHSISRKDENRSLDRVKQIISRELRQTSRRKRQSSRRILLAISRRHRVVVRKARDKINSLIVEKTKKEKNDDDDESKVESSKKRKLTSIVLKFVFKFMLKISSRSQRRIIEIETEIDIETSLSRRSLRKTSTKMIVQSTKKLMYSLESRDDLEMKDVENSSQNKSKKSVLRDSSRKNDASSKR
jgi:hypothetical protein